MSDPSPAATAVDDSTDGAHAALLEFLDRLACVAKSQAMDEWAAKDLTFSQIRVLFSLAAHGQPMPVNEVAEAINLSVAATGRTVDKLVVAGLVDRREDTADRRVKRVSLTAEGTAMVDSETTVKTELVRRFVAGLPETLQEQLRSALHPILTADADYFDVTTPNT